VKTKIFFRRINSKKRNAQVVEKPWGNCVKKDKTPDSTAFQRGQVWEILNFHSKVHNYFLASALTILKP